MAYSETRFAPAKESWWEAPWVAPALIGAAAIAVFGLAQAIHHPTTTPLTSAHVKIVLPDGHGSATHIGDGLYLTAAHVVTDHAEVQINGTASPVLWANATYDIALVSGPEQPASVPLWCGVPAVGEVGVAHGNPMGFENITMTGAVAGEASVIGNWKSAIPVDVGMAPGMSGGAYVIGGALVGVNVGVALAPTGPLSASTFGLAIVVPGSVVCSLMGRT